ncbi:MAG TPA: VirK family protein [Rhabdochlamydiaceae bacterium]
MKKVFLFSLAIMATAFLNVFGSSINSYQKLRSGICKGKQFVILLDLQQCTTGKPGMPMGYFAPSAMMLIPPKEGSPERVMTSHLHFSEYGGNPTYEYVRYTFYSDDSVVVQSTFYDPKSFLQLVPPHTFTTSIGKGVFIKTPNLKAK